ncbi:glycosyltransferase family 4 protein [Rickettsiella endosymbiont of Aleochara curtula]|uniref:glycosyltransferase family 4 protein n=1 Tax=Rickettsiella endosymbiont of Aleochara curtula TaxID=3077936 RepID=UPI00313B2E35
MKNILCITDTLNDFKEITKEHATYFFPIKQLRPSEHNFSLFESAFKKLSNQLDLNQIDLILAEYIEALPLIYFIRRAGFYCPSILIPHTNAYPLDILIYFILLRSYPHSEDIILCGSEHAAVAYKKIVDINAKNIATFGIKKDFKPLNRSLCREELQLSKEKKIMLYTGRFMNDKGLETLLAIYSSLLKQKQNVQLIISTSHIDPNYYNTLAHSTKDVIIFYRLERDKLVKLYNAADIYISCALSIFETYGKSPLESIACGTPVVVPAWDGFPYYITPERGYLVKVNFNDKSFVSPYQFATIDQQDCIEKIITVLEEMPRIKSILPNWAYYDYSIQQIKDLIHTLLRSPSSKKFYKELETSKKKLDKSLFSSGVNAIFKFYEIKKIEDLIVKSNEGVFANKCQQGREEILKILHHEIFNSMKSCHEKMEEIQEIEV